jgi:hypothetical protein
MKNRKFIRQVRACNVELKGVEIGLQDLLNIIN